MQEATDTDRVKLLKTLAAHRAFVGLGLSRVARELEDRGQRHDLSKYQDDEFDGFASINRIAREHPYGSDEYKQSMKDGKEFISLHFSRNSHHPEYWNSPSVEMGFLDVIEMVADWWSAWQTYGKSSSWSDGVIKQIERFDTLSDGQWWLIAEVADYLENLDKKVWDRLKNRQRDRQAATEAVEATKKVINIDFDGTVVAHEFPRVGKSIGAEPVLREIVDAGWSLILFTMRSGQSLDDAVNWFKERGIPLWGIQTNPTQHTWTESPKSYAPIMIDDSSLGCPLKPPNPLVSHRPYVDWDRVREMLVERGVLE